MEDGAQNWQAQGRGRGADARAGRFYGALGGRRGRAGGHEHAPAGEGARGRPDGDLPPPAEQTGVALRDDREGILGDAGAGGRGELGMAGGGGGGGPRPPGGGAEPPQTPPPP